jgi:hypothetical protein
MFQEIKDYLHLLQSNSQEKQKRNFLIVAILVIITLFVLNHFVLNDLISDDLIVRFQQSNLLFINNLSPYDDEVQNYLKNEIDDLDFEPNPIAFDFETGLPQLVYYLPFSFFQEINWGVSLYTTFSMFSYLFAVYLLFKVSRIEFFEIDSIILFLFSIFSLYILRIIFAGETNAISFLTVVAVVYLSHQGKNLAAGILLGLVAFELFSIPVILAIILIGLVRSQNTVAIVWAIITSSLITLATMIFDRNWLIGWLRNLYLQPHTVPFLTYPEALSMRYGFPTFQLFSIISLLLIIWLVYEVWQNPFNSSRAWLWMLGFGGIINYFLIIQSTDVSAPYLLFSQTIIISIWRERIPKNKRIILFISIAINTLFIGAIYFIPAFIQTDRLFNIFMLVSSFLLMLNLYWLKRWAIIPYDYEKLSWEN